MTRFVVGVDGGGTRTRVAIADEHGRVVGQATSGPSNHDDIPPDRVAQNLDSALQEALSHAGLPNDQPIAAAFLGLAGVVSDHDHERIRAIIATTRLRAAARLDIDHDIRIALAGGLAGRPGVALIAGTGSACYGRTSDGRSCRAGGWGHLLADEGSGYWLGVQGLRTAMRMFDGRTAKTMLAPTMLDALGVESADRVMHRVYVEGMSRAAIAGLAPRILALAQGGDEACLAFVDEGAVELVRCVATVASQLSLIKPPLEVAYAGSILESAALMRHAVSKRLGTALPGARLVEPELPPVQGACLLALATLGVDLIEAATNLEPASPR